MSSVAASFTSVHFFRLLLFPKQLDRCLAIVRNGLATDICGAALFLAHMDKVGGLLDNVTQSCINALTDWCTSYQKGEIAINSSRSLGLFVHKELLSWKPKPYRPIQRMLELNFLTLILDTNYVLRRQTDLRIISK